MIFLIKFVVTIAFFFLFSFQNTYSGIRDVNNSEAVLEELEDEVDELKKSIEKKEKIKKEKKAKEIRDIKIIEQKKRNDLKKKIKVEQKKSNDLENQIKIEKKKSKDLELKLENEVRKRKKLENKIKSEKESAEKSKQEKITEEEDLKEQELKAENENELKTQEEAFEISDEYLDQQAEDFLQQELNFSQTIKGKELRDAKFEELKKTNVSYCNKFIDEEEGKEKYFTYGDFIEGTIQITDIDYYQSELRLIKEILFFNRTALHLEKNEILNFSKSDIISSIENSEIFRQSEPFGKFLKNATRAKKQSSKEDTYGMNDAQYVWIKGKFKKSGRTNDRKLKMLAGRKVNVLFMKFTGRQWKMCDSNYCFLGVPVDEFVPKTTEWEEKIISYNSLFYFTRNARVGKSNKLKFEKKGMATKFEHLGQEKFDYYFFHQDRMTTLALAQSMAHKNQNFKKCYRDYWMSEMKAKEEELVDW